MLGVDQTSQVLAPRLVAMKVLQNENKLIFSLLPFSFVHLIFLRFLFQ